MNLSRLKRRKPVSRTTKVGLVANGRAGSWVIDIDEQASKSPKWFAQIEGPALSLYFEMSSPDIVPRTLNFLERAGNNRPQSELHLGTFGRAPVCLRADHEFSDRFFFVIGPLGKSCLHVTLSGEDLVQLTQALRQVKEDLES